MLLSIMHFTFKGLYSASRPGRGAAPLCGLVRPGLISHSQKNPQNEVFDLFLFSGNLEMDFGEMRASVTRLKRSGAVL